MDIIVRIEPVAKARAQTVANRGKVWSFTPKKTKDAEAALRLLLQPQITDSFPEHTPIKLTVCFYRTKPKTAKDAMPVRKPDLDNYIKWVSDCLNGLAFPDDSQVTTVVASKRWSTEDYPYITIGLVEDSL